ncbi:MAG: glycosyltransferase family 2 protein [Alphaproteobacteria bacterium]|nr:glycosyltransferase family 2 protein [Alphaproteobacteria bacterium]
MKKQPKVSIVIPVYNVEDYIRQCLESIVNQTLKEIEIIIVNDCSPANEEAIIREFMAQDSRIVYIKNPKNVGLGEARNIGFAKATGEYFGCVDSDDYVDKTMFEKMYLKAKSNDADIAICNLYRIDCQTGVTNIDSCFNVTPDDFILQAFDCAVAAYLRIYKQSFFKKYIKYPFGVKHEDVVPFFTGYLNTKKISFVNEPLYYYRENRFGAITSKTHTKDILIFLNEVIALFKEKGVFEKYKDRLCSFCSQVYYWYTDKPKELYEGIREIILKNFSDVKTKNKKVLMFRKYAYTEKQKRMIFYKNLYKIIPFRFINKKIKLYQ